MPLQQSRPLSASASAEASLQRKRTHELFCAYREMDILRLTKTGNLIEATAAIQRALRGGSGQTNHRSHSVALDATQTSARLWTTVQDQPSPSAPVLPVAFRGMVDRFSRHGHQPAAPVAIPDGAQFEQRLFQNASGSRPYKLYIPSGYAASTKDIPLIVMLHGCTQSADDFAAGTRTHIDLNNLR